MYNRHQDRITQHDLDAVEVITKAQSSFNRYQKYYVCKLADAAKYLTNDELKVMADISRKIEDGRKADNKELRDYIVVSEGQPYATEVWNLIKYQWVIDEINRNMVRAKPKGE